VPAQSRSHIVFVVIVAVIIPIVIMAAEFERDARGHGKRQSIVNTAGGGE
jgi:hypothetical protein